MESVVFGNQVQNQQRKLLRVALHGVQTFDRIVLSLEAAVSNIFTAKVAKFVAQTAVVQLRGDCKVHDHGFVRFLIDDNILPVHVLLDDTQAVHQPEAPGGGQKGVGQVGEVLVRVFGNACAFFAARLLELQDELLHGSEFPQRHEHADDGAVFRVRVPPEARHVNASRGRLDGRHAEQQAVRRRKAAPPLHHVRQHPREFPLEKRKGPEQKGPVGRARGGAPVRGAEQRALAVVRFQSRLAKVVVVAQFDNGHRNHAASALSQQWHVIPIDNGSRRDAKHFVGQVPARGVVVVVYIVVALGIIQIPKVSFQVLIFALSHRIINEQIVVLVQKGILQVV